MEKVKVIHHSSFFSLVNFLQEGKYLQLSISMKQSCLSMGKYCKSMGHDAVIVSLQVEVVEEYATCKMGELHVCIWSDLRYE